MIGKLALRFVLCHDVLQNRAIFAGIKLKYYWDYLNAALLRRTSYLIGKDRDSGRRPCPRRVDQREPSWTPYSVLVLGFLASGANIHLYTAIYMFTSGLEDRTCSQISKLRFADIRCLR